MNKSNQKSTFDIPAGYYLVEITDIYERESFLKGCSREVRIKFKSIEEERPGMTYLAAKNYCWDDGENPELTNDLKEILRDQYKDDNKAIIYQMPVGSRAVIKAEHRFSSGHHKPFVKITRIWNPDNFLNDPDYSAREDESLMLKN
jgi:hypothetical protein